MKAAPGVFWSYLELCRASNLPTVWTNVLAAVLLSGVALADRERWLVAALAAGASVTLIYLGGMALNDVLDLAEDRVKKPFRPIPSGRISVAGAWVFAGALFGSGLLLLGLFCPLPALLAGLALITTVYLYDRLHRLEIARAAREVVGHRAYLSLGSGAIPTDLLKRFKDEDLVDGCCFNLEVWGPKLFASVCPGKQRYVGWERWLESLYAAVDLFGNGNVYTAMVCGVELEPEHGGLSVDEAIANAMEGARTLLARGVIPLWSIYWPLWGTTHPERLGPLRECFERLNAEYAKVREQAGVKINNQFQCAGCAYMQLEVDLDRTW